jgi:hypothetical protein
MKLDPTLRPFTMKRTSVTLLFGLLASLLLTPLWLAAQTTPMLQVVTIGVTTGGPLEFTFRDAGTGATNYVAEFSLDVGAGASWTHDTTAVITPLGEGEYRAVIPSPAGLNGFYRIVGLGGVPGEILINFASTAFQVSEGDMVSPTIAFSAPFTGIIRYTISGTATSGDYAPLSGEVQVVNAMTATIPIALTDDDTIGELRNLILTLEAGSGAQLGAATRVTITIDENDARWAGSFIDGTATLPFHLELTRTGGTTQGTLAGDGWSFFPSEPVSAVVVQGATSFSAFVTGIPMAAEATLLNLPAVLELELNAVAGEPDQEVEPNFIRGDATLSTSYPGHAHLNTVNRGRFLMQRPSVAPSTRAVELLDTP